jgi:hypothetical protein
MSRLDSFIRRLTAQRDCLDMAARLVEGVAGPVLELGLGNGRSYDHLRTLFPTRDIFVFDRQVAAHPDCRPDARHMILGDFAETLPGALGRIGAPAALIHCDVGSGEADANRRLALLLAPLLVPLATPGAVVLADQEMLVPTWQPLALPPGVKPGRYFMWRA